MGEVEVTLPNGQSKVQELYNDTIIGFNKNDEEVARVTVEEPTFERPANEASWGISGYLNSPNVGRPNPAPTAYTAPATFDAATRLSTWGDGTVASNDDGTVTLSFEGATVNHAKTGGGWLRLADLEATLGADGNGVVSAVVSYGTMAPPAVFDPLQLPARGPERVDIVVTSGTGSDPRSQRAVARWDLCTC